MCIYAIHVYYVCVIPTVLYYYMCTIYSMYTYMHFLHHLASPRVLWPSMCCQFRQIAQDHCIIYVYALLGCESLCMHVCIP